MSKSYDGGPAFPADSYATGDGGRRPVIYSGMTLRDYFAIHVQEPTAQQVNDYMTGWTKLDTRLARAQLRYLEADAMLKARQA